MKSLKKLVILPLLLLGLMISAQTSSNRFFYELTFKPKKDSAKIETVMTTLDITKDKSLYRDFTWVAQDSIIKVQVEEMQKAGVFKDMSKSMKMPKFAYKVEKVYPDMKVIFEEGLQNGMTPMKLGYVDNIKFNWNITSDKEKIGTYNTQKATTEFGGRKWNAWFSTDLPFQDGPYKFYGLPGLIVKIEDEGKNYSWELKGNKKVDNFEELSYIEKVSPGGNTKRVEVSREKFETTIADFKKDPFATIRPMLKPEMMSQKLPGSDSTIGEMVKKQEKMLKDFYDANDNPIEIVPVAEKKKK
ncbi:GLPGLI family protein [Epilithonimonas sp.]|uniref:GLPGLI family protein n=1 Tax=Epilithonimonas sp. TaxID=2894511 RepID=UPI002899E9AA|nr:GLPGLI family protein [Epilithonimonas sp.]